MPSLRARSTRGVVLALIAVLIAGSVVVLIAGSIAGSVVGASAAYAESASVRGILFYDPTCHNCEVVLTEILPPLESRHGDQLQIVRVDTSTLQGFDLWTTATKAYNVANERKGVPLLFVGDTVLSGEDEIAAQLAGTIESGLAAGGIPLPAALGLTEADVTMWLDYEGQGHEAGPDADPLATALALLVLGGMLLSLFYVAVLLWRSRPLGVDRIAGAAIGTRSLVVPVLALGGLAVAGYLSYLKWNSTPGICPIGDCDAVQHSSWALMLGVPVSYLGFLTYVVVLVLWLVTRLAHGKRSQLASIALLAVLAFGTAFSAYLTFLEPFVIKAVCIWCLISAVTITTALLTATRGLPAQPADVP